MTSRRKFVSLVGLLGVGMAGCINPDPSGSDSGGSNSPGCKGHTLDSSGGDVITRIYGTAEGDDVRLEVALYAETIQNQNVARFVVYDMSGELEYVIPVSSNDKDVLADKDRPGASSEELHYEQYLGQRPFHGQYRVVAENEKGEELDSITTEFNCFAENNR